MRRDGDAPGAAGSAGREERLEPAAIVAQLRCPRCGAALELDQVDRRRLALAAFEPRPGQRFDVEVSRLLDRVIARLERDR